MTTSTFPPLPLVYGVDSPQIKRSGTGVIAQSTLVFMGAEVGHIQWQCCSRWPLIHCSSGASRGYFVMHKMLSKNLARNH